MRVVLAEGSSKFAGYCNKRNIQIQRRRLNVFFCNTKAVPPTPPPPHPLPLAHIVFNFESKKPALKAAKSVDSFVGKKFFKDLPK